MSTHRLISNRNSPYARKVRLAIGYLGLQGLVIEQDEKIGQVVFNETVTSANPIGQIPVLSTEDGTWLHDSSVIVEYLNERYGERRLLSSALADPWKLRTLASLADAIIQSSILILRERSRPAGLSWSDFIDAQQHKLVHALDALARETSFQAILLEQTVAGIGLSVALDFVLLRGPLIGIDLARWPSLHQALQRKAADDLFIATRPAIK
ncbi:glutathione S-transferase family protein [Pseudomonas sp. LRF_L74]|uniref:glutathione S-transferase family protein n=1 Tax=Pseudomonas sp. LRF_L74 TaxID=3369422 RepID=UPI003F62983B